VGVGDELSAGVPVVGAPGIGGELDLGQGALLMATVLSAPIAMGMLLEAPIHALSDGADRRRLLRIALGAASLTLAAGALAPGPVVLAVALGAWGVATGVACGLAQGGLVAASRDEPGRAMTRWALATSVGDLAAPLVMGALAAFGLGWRAGMGVAAAFAAVTMLIALGAESGVSDEPAGPSDEGPSEDSEASLRDGVFAALRDRRLLSWLAAVAACTLLDEIALMLGALRLAHDPTGAMVELGALVAGDAVGLLVVQGALARRRMRPRTILISSCAIAAVTLVGWVTTADHLLVATPFAFVLGASAAIHWPLAKAEAFACLPGRPGMVNALDTVANGVDLVAPLLLGWLVSVAGVDAALLALIAQPAVVGVVAALAPVGSGSTPPLREIPRGG